MISVIIPTYNRANRIKASLESVMTQTYTDIEIIVVDDGSADNTEEVIRSLNDGRIKYVRYEINQGACHARNVGIDEAEGDYIAFHDSDDVWKRDKLEKQLECIEQNNADMLLCKIEVHKSNGKIEYYPEVNKSCFVDYGLVLAGGVGSTQTFMAKARVFKDIHFDELMPRSQDTEVLIRISKKYKIYYLNEVLCCKYDQDDSLTRNVKNMVVAQERILSKFYDDFLSYPKAKAVHLNAMANAKALLGMKNIDDRISILRLDFSMKNILKFTLSLFHLDRIFIRG